MTELNQVYKCQVCGNMVEVVHGAMGELVCCGKKMILLEERDADAALEKHVPIVEKTGDEVMIKVGSVPHPMEDKHYIEWIELITSNKVYRKYLKAGEKPEAVFKTSGDIINVREYCNIHGLWRTK